MCYVDDPLVALHGTERVRMRNATRMVLVWEALGCAMAYHKGQLGDIVTWIGGTLSTEADGVRARVNVEIVSDICLDLERFLASDVIPLKELHSLIGKLVH